MPNGSKIVLGEGRYFFSGTSSEIELLFGDNMILLWKSRLFYRYLFEVRDTFLKIERRPEFRTGYSFEIVARNCGLWRDTSGMSRETFVCLQLILSLLFCIALNENEADRFSSTKIEILTYFSKEYLFGFSIIGNK